MREAFGVRPLEELKARLESKSKAPGKTDEKERE